MPGAFELPQAARVRGRDRALRRGRLPRLRDSRRDAALRLHRVGGRARASWTRRGETGVPMAFGVLTTDTREQAEERAGDGRDNKGCEAAAAAIEMAALFRGAARDAGAAVRIDRRARRLVTARHGAARARPRCRCSISGRSGAPARTRPSSRTGRRTTPSRRRRRRRCATFANAPGARHARRGSTEIDALIAAHAQNWRVERMAVIDRLVLRLAIYELLRRAGDAGRRSSSTRRSSWRGRSAATRPCAFVNGVLDAVRKDAATGE